jgi:hypothetical protein
MSDVIKTAAAEDDQLWREDGERRGWRLPPPAPWPMRLPGVRHLRAVWMTFWIEQHYRYGLGSIGIRTGYDEWVTHAVWRGWA